MAMIAVPSMLLISQRTTGVEGWGRVWGKVDILPAIILPTTSAPDTLAGATRVVYDTISG